MKKKLVWVTLFSIIGLGLGSIYSSYLIRAIVYNHPSIEDYKIFPERRIHHSENTFAFPVDTTKFDLTTIDDQFSKKYGLLQYNTLESMLEQTETTAFIVLKNDTIVYEKYFNGYTRSSINTSFSTSKAFASALVGIAIDEGYIESINDRVAKYLPEIKQRTSPDLTIKSLLTMTSGIAYDSESVLWGDDAKSYYGIDLREYALDFTMQSKPGGRFKYNNINPLLIGMILERTTGMTVSQYLEDKIWKVLGMEYPASWSLDEKGFEKMESGINARAIDFLKFGRLYLTNGAWGDQQLIPEEYIRASTRIDPANPVLRNIYREISYAYSWWVLDRYLGPDDFYAEGNLGQFIFVSPYTKTVIVRHGKAYGYSRWPEFFNHFTNELSGLPLSDNPFEIKFVHSGLQSAIEFADSLIESNATQKISEFYLNNKGYKLLSTGNIEAAIKVFKLNVRTYPESYNVYDSLGEAYKANKQNELALINYQRSLALNPKNNNAVEAIKSLN